MTPFVVVAFDRRAHDRAHFSSGEPRLDTWLRERAGQSERQHATRTYVISEAGLVIGYYSLCAFSVESDSVPPAARAGGHPVPAVLLARLAVDERQQGRGVGSALLLDALTVSARVSDSIGAKLLVVHALHERAADYYGKHGFRAFEREPLTLYLLMQDIQLSLRSVGLL